MNTVAKSINVAATAALLAISGVGAIAHAAPAKADKELVHCYGINTCKGTSDCATATTSCKGQNECSGQGFVSKTAKECVDLGGRLTEAKSEAK
jgi:uncharacterized membrane protein